MRTYYPINRCCIAEIINRLRVTLSLGLQNPIASPSYVPCLCGSISILTRRQANGILMLIRAISGESTHSSTTTPSTATVFNSDSFNESVYVQHIMRTSNNVPLVLGWYNAFKVVGLFCMGYNTEAAELGFSVYDSAKHHPNHRHIRFALCYHSLALINYIRTARPSVAQRERYLNQVSLNQAYIRKYVRFLFNNALLMNKIQVVGTKSH